MRKTIMILGALVGFGVGLAMPARADLFDLGGHPLEGLDDPWAWGTSCDRDGCTCSMQWGGEAACADFESRCEENEFDRPACRVMSTGFFERVRPQVVCTCSPATDPAGRRPDHGGVRPDLDLR